MHPQMNLVSAPILSTVFNFRKSDSHAADARCPSCSLSNNHQHRPIDRPTINPIFLRNFLFQSQFNALYQLLTPFSFDSLVLFSFSATYSFFRRYIRWMVLYETATMTLINNRSYLMVSAPLTSRQAACVQCSVHLCDPSNRFTYL